MINFIHEQQWCRQLKLNSRKQSFNCSNTKKYKFNHFVRRFPYTNNKTVSQFLSLKTEIVACVRSVK